MRKTIVVAGTWNMGGGKRSGYIDKVFAGTDVTLYNGGVYSDLIDVIDVTQDYDTIIWLVDVPNDFPKLVNGMKVSKDQKLIISKNNRDMSYTYEDFCKRMELANADALIEFNKTDDGIIRFRIHTGYHDGCSWFYEPISLKEIYEHYWR